MKKSGAKAMTNVEKNAKRRKQLKDLAIKLGFTSWSAVETSLLRGSFKIISNKS